MSSGMAVACRVDSTVGGTSDWLSVVMMNDPLSEQYNRRLYESPRWTKISSA